MKKILIFLMLLSTNLMATEITVIVSGKPGGSFFDRSQMYIESLKVKGYDVKVDNIGNSSQSASAFKSSNVSTIMVWANNQAALNDLPHTKNNFILLEYEDSLFLCGSPDLKDKKIAYSKSHPKSILTKILKDHGINNPKMIPYKNSGDMYKAIMAGEVDGMINTQSSSSKYLKLNKGICHAQTSSKNALGIPVFQTKQKVLPILHLTVIGKNLSKELKDDIRKISQNETFENWREKRGIVGIGNDYDQQLTYVRDNETVWNIKD